MAASCLQTRWAAIGAAVAVSLGAGGIGISQATTSSGERPIYVPIEPCRLADTRPAPSTVGPRSTPLGANETYNLSGWGTVGDCPLPSGTTGLSLNVTAIGPTLPTFLTLFPAASTLPTASHLNPAPGQPPTPNAVNVDLDTSGEFSIYNKQGLVNVIIDVVGYYDDHNHDDRYYTETEVDAELAALDASRSFAVTATDPGATLTGATQVVASVEVTAPVDGHVTVNSRTLAQHDGADGSDVGCGIEPAGTLTTWLATSADVQWFERDNGAANKGSLAGTRTFSVTAGSTNTFTLTCREIIDGGQVRHTTLTAIFTPAP